MTHDHSFIPRFFLFKYDGAPESNHHHHGHDGSTLYHEHDDKPDHSHETTVRYLGPEVGYHDFGPADHTHDT